jgi:hypothetical protein
VKTHHDGQTNKANVTTMKNEGQRARRWGRTDTDVGSDMVVKRGVI